MKHTGRPMFDELYREPAQLEQFMHAMTSLSAAGFHSLAEVFDFSQLRTLCDVGGATGQLSLIVVARHQHMRCTTFDLPAVEPIARRAIEAANLADRVNTASGDVFVDRLPEADVITMSNVLHDFNLAQKMFLIQAAYDVLPPGGTLIVLEPLIDDARRDVVGLLVSMNMMIEFGDGFAFTGGEFMNWCTETGFERVEVVPLAGPVSAGIARK